jgi:hypothetical protein
MITIFFDFLRKKLAVSQKTSVMTKCFSSNRSLSKKGQFGANFWAKIFKDRNIGPWLFQIR